MTELVGDRAVVLGGSMAGLLAARVLADAYAEVVVVDRDTMSGVSTARRGVPQGRHAHGVLARGQEVLEELFPGFTAGLIEEGIPVGDLGSQVRWYFNGKMLQKAHTGLALIGIARPDLEHRVRERVAARTNVRFVEQHDIVALTASPDRQRVIGVVVQRRSTDSIPEEITADLVVDASGRASRTPVWLAELGYPAVAEERIKVGLTYTSRRYRWRTDPFRGDMSINPVATPSHPRGAFLHTLGGDECLLSLTGILGDSPPTDQEGFLAFARSLPVPDVYDAIRDAQPLDDPVAFQFPASQRRRYERLSHLPAGLLAVGDAVCSFNPVYGQGMTVAALEALVLREHLAAGRTPDSGEFFADIAKVIDVPWEIAAGGDLAFAQVEGHRSLKVRMGNIYLARLQSAATRDGSLTESFLRVAGLIDPPEALMRPGLALRTFGLRRPAVTTSVAAG